jgi:hypothetical protein
MYSLNLQLPVQYCRGSQNVYFYFPLDPVIMEASSWVFNQLRSQKVFLEDFDRRIKIKDNTVTSENGVPSEVKVAILEDKVTILEDKVAILEDKVAILENKVAILEDIFNAADEARAKLKSLCLVHSGESTVQVLGLYHMANKSVRDMKNTLVKIKTK